MVEPRDDDVSPEEQARLAARIQAARARHEAASGRPDAAREATRQKDAGALAQALSISAQLVVAVALGTLLGWQMDLWFGTKPSFSS